MVKYILLNLSESFWDCELSGKAKQCGQKELCFKNHAFACYHTIFYFLIERFMYALTSDGSMG